MMKTIKECYHDKPRAVGQGYALCDDCGAMLPDEDPDLWAKAHEKEQDLRDQIANGGC